MDTIFIQGLKAEAIIGVYEWEHQVPQSLILDIEFNGDVHKAALTDSIHDTVHYHTVADRVLDFIAQQRFHLVETYAEHIAMLILEEFGVEWVKLTIVKPGGVKVARGVGVTLKRERSALPAWRDRKLP
jgi:dihydroneopterin aldolase